MNIFLRILQFSLVFGTNTVLIYYVQNEEAVSLLETLIYVNLSIQTIFGTIGTYVQNRLKSKIPQKMIEKPDLLILHLIPILILVTFLSLILDEYWIISIILLTLAQGGFNFANSYLGISKSIRKSLLNSVYVYLLFLSVLLVTVYYNIKFTAFMWIFYFSCANLIVLCCVILQLDTLPARKYKKSTYLLFDKNLYRHALGHLTVTFIGWYIFLYSRTFFSDYQEGFYPEFLKVAVVYSIITGACELLYNTIFLTKVYRNPDDDDAYLNYADGLTFVVISCSFFMFFISGLLGAYYFPPNFIYLEEIFRILVLIESLKLLFNIWINNCARKFAYRKLIKIGLICMVLISLLNYVVTIEQVLICIFVVQVIVVYFLFNDRVLSLDSGVCYLISLVAVVLMYDVSTWWDISFLTLSVSSIAAILFLRLALRLKIASLLKEFIHYD